MRLKTRLHNSNGFLSFYPNVVIFTIEIILRTNLMNKSLWTSQYPKGIPQQIDYKNYTSVLSLLEESFQKFGARTSYINMGKEISYADLDKYTARFACYLQNELKLEKGSRVVVQMPNILQYPIAMMAILRAGMVVVNTNPLYTTNEMEHQFKDSGAETIVILANFACNLEKILDKTLIKNVIITEIGDMLGGLKGTFVNFAVKRIKKMVPAYNLPEAVKFREALKIGSRSSYQRPEVQSEDIAFLQYTGGTTGVSKGAMLSHSNILTNALQIKAWMAPKLRENEEFMVTALPLYHIFALTINCFSMLIIGAQNLLITNPRDMPGFVKELTKYPFTVITGVNTLFNGLLNNPDFKNAGFENLKVAVGGGMAVQDTVARNWEATTGVPLAEGYGLTESSPVLTCNPVDGTEQIGTIGLPLPGTDVKILDDEGNEVPLGERGELCALGKQVMLGYWQRPDETVKVMEDGWLKTGDIAVMLEDGFFKIVDRKKEMILVSGFNVYPNEVENVISSHPKVLEVGAIGVPDTNSTEAVKVFVVKSDDSLTVEELKEYCRASMTGYKCPKHVEFKDELPKSNVGKILRRILKEEDMKNQPA